MKSIADGIEKNIIDLGNLIKDPSSTTDQAKDVGDSFADSVLKIRSLEFKYSKAIDIIADGSFCGLVKCGTCEGRGKVIE